MVIERILAVTQEIVEALDRLVPQLTKNNPAPTMTELEALVNTRTNVLLVARESENSGRIVAAGCVSVYRVSTGVRAVIEDVVVDASARGQV